MDWETTGRLASLLGSLKIAERGAQNHLLVRSCIEDAFRAAFGRSLT
jgi:adenosine kinase